MEKNAKIPDRQVCSECSCRTATAYIGGRLYCTVCRGQMAKSAATGMDPEPLSVPIEHPE